MDTYVTKEEADAYFQKRVEEENQPVPIEVPQSVKDAQRDFALDYLSESPTTSPSDT